MAEELLVLLLIRFRYIKTAKSLSLLSTHLNLKIHIFQSVVSDTSNYYSIPFCIFLPFNKVKESISELGTFMQHILPTALVTG